MPQLKTEIILAAIAGFEQQKTHIDDQITDLKAMLSGHRNSASTPTSGAPTRKRKKFSAAARRRMREAQKARWAKVRGESAASPKAAKPKRKLSAAGRKAIIAATKKRWRLQRAKAAKA